MAATAIYRSVMMAFETRRLELGWSMATVDEMAGTQDGYYAKMIYPDTPSGRQARWETVQWVAEAMFGKDFTVHLEAGAMGIRAAPRIDKGASSNALQNRHWRHRKHFQVLGALGARALNNSRTPEQRSKAARKAVKTRWKRQREAKRRGDAHQDSNALKARPCETTTP